MTIITIFFFADATSNTKVTLLIYKTVYLMELKDIPSEDNFESTSERKQSVSFCLLYAFSSLQLCSQRFIFKVPVSKVFSSYESF